MRRTGGQHLVGRQRVGDVAGEQQLLGARGQRLVRRRLERRLLALVADLSPVLAPPGTISPGTSRFSPGRGPGVVGSPPGTTVVASGSPVGQVGGLDPGAVAEPACAGGVRLDDDGGLERLVAVDAAGPPALADRRVARVLREVALGALGLGVVARRVQGQPVVERGEALGDGVHGRRRDHEQREEAEQHQDRDGGPDGDGGLERRRHQVADDPAACAHLHGALRRRGHAGRQVHQAGRRDDEEAGADAHPAVRGREVGVAHQPDAEEQQHQREREPHAAERARDHRVHDVAEDALDPPPLHRGHHDRERDQGEPEPVAAQLGVEVAGGAADPARGATDQVRGAHEHAAGRTQRQRGALRCARRRCLLAPGRPGRALRRRCGGAGRPRPAERTGEDVRVAMVEG